MYEVNTHLFLRLDFDQMCNLEKTFLRVDCLVNIHIFGYQHFAYLVNIHF